MIAVGQNNPKTKSKAAILTNVLGILGVLALVFFGYALVMTVMDFWIYATVQTWRDLYIPIVLSLLFLPFIFVLYVVMSYETTFSALHFRSRMTACGAERSGDLSWPSAPMWTC